MFSKGRMEGWGLSHATTTAWVPGENQEKLESAREGKPMPGGSSRHLLHASPIAPAGFWTVIGTANFRWDIASICTTAAKNLQIIPCIFCFCLEFRAKDENSSILRKSDLLTKVSIWYATLEALSGNRELQLFNLSSRRYLGVLISHVRTPSDEFAVIQIRHLLLTAEIPVWSQK